MAAASGKAKQCKTLLVPWGPLTNAGLKFVKATIHPARKAQTVAPGAPSPAEQSHAPGPCTVATADATQATGRVQTKARTVEERIKAVADIAAEDLALRGISRLYAKTEGSLHKACESLHDAETVVITTGFFIPNRDHPKGGALETDGPPGSWVLGEALRALGKKVVYLTDAPCAEACAKAGLTPVRSYEEGCLRDVSPTHLVSIERVGRSADDHYYNMHAVKLDAFTAPIDNLFIDAKRHGIHTIAVGDGGNEIGMGVVRDEVIRENVPDPIKSGAKIACTVGVDELVVAGVSNWGGEALAVGLSVLAGRDLLPSSAALDRHLELLLSAGAVDGVTKQPAKSVDNLPWSVHQRKLAALREAGGLPRDPPTAAAARAEARPGRARSRLPRLEPRSGHLSAVV